MTYADYVNLLGDDIETIKRETESLIDTGKEVGLAVNVDKTKYMLVSGHQNAASPNWDIKLGNRLFKNMLQFKYLGILIQEEINKRLNSGNTCCDSVKNLLFSCLLSKNVEIRI
jgi:hypothetical protein